MAELLTVREGLDEWNGDSVLLKDEETGQHYVVSTVTMPWQEEPGESFVYETDEHGHTDWWGHAHQVAGGAKMTAAEARFDLERRLDSGTLLSFEEAEAQSSEFADEDYDLFVQWVLDGGDPDLADGLITKKAAEKGASSNA